MTILATFFTRPLLFCALFRFRLTRHTNTQRSHAFDLSNFVLVYYSISPHFIVVVPSTIDWFVAVVNVADCGHTTQYTLVYSCQCIDYKKFFKITLEMEANDQKGFTLLTHTRKKSIEEGEKAKITQRTKST